MNACLGAAATFYGGVTRDAAWGIGWAAFDHPNDRCEAPLTAPPDIGDDGDIALAAPLIDAGGTAQLHMVHDDRICHRVAGARHGEDSA